MINDDDDDDDDVDDDHDADYVYHKDNTNKPTTIFVNQSFVCSRHLLSDCWIFLTISN